MVGRDEYERVIESFMMEMPGIVVTTEPALRKLPHLGPELDEYMPSLRDPAASPEQVLRTAFGLIDEFVREKWSIAIAESYQLYCDLARGGSGSGGAAA
jgi:hypothetical protein